MAKTHVVARTAAIRAKALAEGDYRTLVFDVLTPRQRDSLTMLAKGLALKEAGAHLKCSPWTEAARRASIYRRLDVGSAPEAAVIAAKAGLV